MDLYESVRESIWIDMDLWCSSYFLMYIIYLYIYICIYYILHILSPNTLRIYILYQRCDARLWGLETTNSTNQWMILYGPTNHLCKTPPQKMKDLSTRNARISIDYNTSSNCIGSHLSYLLVFRWSNLTDFPPLLTSLKMPFVSKTPRIHGTNGIFTYIHLP